MEPRGEAQLEDRSGAGARDRELGREAIGRRQVPLAAELERLELDLDLVAVLLAGPQPHRAQAEALHTGQGTEAQAASLTGSRTGGRAGAAAPRAVTINATETTIAALAPRMRRLSDSPRNTAPRATAIAGLTNA